MKRVSIGRQLNGVKAFKVVFEIGEQEKLEAKDMKEKI